MIVLTSCFGLGIATLMSSAPSTPMSATLPSNRYDVVTLPRRIAGKDIFFVNVVFDASGSYLAAQTSSHSTLLFQFLGKRLVLLCSPIRGDLLGTLSGEGRFLVKPLGALSDRPIIVGRKPSEALHDDFRWIPSQCFCIKANLNKIAAYDSKLNQIKVGDGIGRVYRLKNASLPMAFSKDYFLWSSNDLFATKFSAGVKSKRLASGLSGELYGSFTSGIKTNTVFIVEPKGWFFEAIDVSTKKVLFRSKGWEHVIDAISCSSDGSEVAVGSFARHKRNENITWNKLVLFDGFTGRVLEQPYFHSEGVEALLFAPKGKNFAEIDRSGDVNIFLRH